MLKENTKMSLEKKLKEKGSNDADEESAEKTIGRGKKYRFSCVANLLTFM